MRRATRRPTNRRRGRGHAAAGAAQARRIGPPVDLCERGADGRGGARADAGRARHPAPGRRRPLGVAMFNPHCLLAGRLLDRDAARPIDRRFLLRRLERALRLRERLFDEPYYRLVHAEADGLPGLVVDRFGAVLVVQSNAAGMARLEPLRARRFGRAVAAAGDRAAQRQPGAGAGGAAVARRGSALGAFDAPVPGPRKRRPISDRSARRAEDRLVFRPAR